MKEIKPVFHALTRNKVGAILLLVQIAITTAIVSNAAFIIADRVAFLNQPTGFPEEQIARFHTINFGDDINESQQIELDEEVLRAIPGVIDAAYTSAVPISGSGSNTSFRNRPASEQAGKSIPTAYYQGDDHFLNTVGVKLIEGRNFRPEEVVTTGNPNDIANAVLISKPVADALFENESALGKTVYMGDMPLEVIGITEHISAPWLTYRGKHNVAILPFIMPSHVGKYLIRTKYEDQANVMAQLENKMLAAYDKRVINNLSTLKETKRNITDGDILMTRMLITLIVILVLVTALGIFGLTLFNISKRTKQIGTRRALGARKSSIIGYFLTENAIISLAGVTIGGLLAWGLGKELMELYSVPALSWQFVLGTVLAMLLMSLLAVISPAMRAASISPSIATRSV